MSRLKGEEALTLPILRSLEVLEPLSLSRILHIALPESLYLCFSSKYQRGSYVLTFRAKFSSPHSAEKESE